MAQSKKKKTGGHNRAADRAYDYLTARKGRVLRYITAALITALIEFLITYFGGIDLTIIAMVIRFLLLFPIAKYWVYKEKGMPIFYVLQQIMIAIMAILLLETGIYFIINLLAQSIGYPTVVRYIGIAVMEILLFIIFQFLIFKEKKD